MFKKSPPKRLAFTMNNYFLALFLFAAFYRFFGISIKMTSIISIMLSIIKYIRIFITMVTPEKKMSIEFLRGNILKVNYNADIFDSDDESEDLGEIKEQKASDQNPNISSNGIKEDGYFLLKYGDEKKKWTKVEAVTNVSFQRGPIVIEELETTSEPKEIPKREEIHIEEKPKPIIVDVDIELQTDIADVAGEPEIEEMILYKDDDNMVLMNIYPYNRGHLEVVPRKHYTDLNELKPDELKNFFLLVQKTITLIREVIKPDGINLGFNLGKAAGSSVEHLHLHLVPRFKFEGGFMETVASTRVISENLDETYKRYMKEIQLLR